VKDPVEIEVWNSTDRAVPAQGRGAHLKMAAT
jgi:hypothetical protein